MTVPQVAGTALVCGQELLTTLQTTGPFDAKFTIWAENPEVSPVVGSGTAEMVAPADMLSNIPELWNGTAKYDNDLWVVSGTLTRLRLERRVSGRGQIPATAAS